MKYTPYKPQGKIKDIWSSRELLVLVEGGAGTGKTRGILEKLNILASHYPGVRILIVRLTRHSITQTTMVTYEDGVKPEAVKYNGRVQGYLYPNKSVIVIAGLDDASKKLGGDYDYIYVNEVNQIPKVKVMTLQTRLRNFKAPYQQLLMDINPVSKKFYANLWAKEGKAQRIETTIKDNAKYWNEAKNDFTYQGNIYYNQILGNLEGRLKERFKDGLWGTQEGLVYSMFDDMLHKIAPFEIPRSWRKIRGFDYGYNDATVCLFSCVVPYDFKYKVNDSNIGTYEILIPANSIIVYKEWYYSRRTIDEHKDKIIEISNPKHRYEGVGDHNAANTAYLIKHGIPIVNAFKSISLGIQAVISRLRPEERTGRPTLYFVDDLSVEIDPVLEKSMQPVTIFDEFDLYSWPKIITGWGEVPVDKYNHAMDTLRYIIALADNLVSVKDLNTKQYVERRIVEQSNFSNILN